jgi:cytochrome oxidase assembly protein ShyY1
VDRPPGQGSGLPDGQVERIVAPQLVQRWPYPLLTGYVVATAQRPVPAGPAPAAVRADPPSGGELDLRNLSYALQWWLFAAFGLFFWWRIVRDDHRGRAGEPAEAVPSGPPPAREGDAVPTPDRGARP